MGGDSTYYESKEIMKWKRNLRMEQEFIRTAMKERSCDVVLAVVEKEQTGNILSLVSHFCDHDKENM